MMNVLRSMFGVCSGSAEKGEVHDIIRRVFGNEMVLKDNTEKHNQRNKYVTHVKENLPKMLDTKIASHNKIKSSKKSTTPILTDTTAVTDDRIGRIGSKIVVFDASTGTGRLVLVGDERVSVQGLSSFATIRATACVYSGKWMYEVQLGTKGIMQIGWCTSSCVFSMDTGVGDTAHSYAYDGGRIRKWNVVTSPYGQSWLPGDVIGSCIDLDKGTLEFYRNGISMGIAFDKVSHGAGLAYFPAVSLAMQEHLYANFGHVPFVFPVDGFSPLQIAPSRECSYASILFKSLDALVDEMIQLNNLKPPVTTKSSKAKSESSKAAEEEVALRIHSSGSIYSPRASPHSLIDAQSTENKRMSKKAFLISLARLVVMELGNTLRLSYVVVAELLPRFRGAVGLKTTCMHVDQHAMELFIKFRDDNFNGLSTKLLTQPNPKLCTLLDLLWTFLDEAALCDIIEHCIVRECLLYDLVSQDMYFTQQIEGVYMLCGLMQHRETRHHLVKYVFFNKISFDNFLNIKCPDDTVLRTVIRNPWWQRPTSVHGETDPRVIEVAEKGIMKNFARTEADKITKLLPSSQDDSATELQYKEDCGRITKAIAPLEQIQLEFLLILMDNNDGTNMVPSTRKIFLEKFRRYIMDNCILDMRLFNISRNSPAISWCCHARLLTALLKLWNECPMGNPQLPPHLPARTFIEGELDFYNVDRLGGVLPFLVRTLRQDLINVLGEDNPFVQSFEPSYNRAGGIDTGVSDMTAGSPGLATLPQVISSMARFLHQPMPPLPNRPTGETALAIKGTRSVMPGAGSVDIRTTHLRLVDGLLALYHGAAIKHAEKLCELRDNQLDMADCLYDIEQRIYTITTNLHSDIGNTNQLLEQDNSKKLLLEKMLQELQKSKKVYEEKLEAGSLQMGWVIGAIWTKQRQSELAKQFSGTLHSLRLSSDPEYAAQVQVASKEILPGKSSLLGGTSYASLQLEYTSSSDQSPQSPTSTVPTPCIGSNSQIGLSNQIHHEFTESLFAFVPEYHVDTMLELCNTLRLYMHPTIPVQQIPEWEELVVSCAMFLCAEFADQRIVLASTKESLVQTLASFATQPATMRAIERVPLKQQMRMVEELMRPYQNRAWAQSNWVLVRFWHGSGFGFRHRQWPHLAAKYGDREPTVNNLGAKVDAGLMSQCFGPCPSEIIQSRVGDYLTAHPVEAASYLNSLLSQLNWAFSEFINMMQEMDRVTNDALLESRQIKLCATCFDLYHGLARALEMTLHIAPLLLSKPEACDKQNELLLGRSCQILMAVVSRVCVRGGGGASFSRLVSRGLPDTDRVHYYVALAPVAGCLLRMFNPTLPPEHLDKVTKALIMEPLFRLDGLEFMLGKSNDKHFSFYKYPDDVTVDELKALEVVVDRLRVARDALITARSPGSSGAQSDLLCTICYARPADTAFMPCGHHSCRACIMQHLLNSKQCFFCKAEIDSVREIEPANN